MKQTKSLVKLLLPLLLLALFLMVPRTVSAADVSIKLNKAVLKGEVSEKIQLTATVTGSDQAVKWKSSNKKVATVSQKGVVTLKKAGTCKITATVNGKKASCKVKSKKLKIIGKTFVVGRTTGTYVTFKLKKNGKFTGRTYKDTLSGTYTLSGNKLTVKYKENGSTSATYKAVLRVKKTGGKYYMTLKSTKGISGFLWMLKGDTKEIWKK